MGPRIPSSYTLQRNLAAICGGDSGSCVWDMPGRIAGILTGGPTNRGVNDVTYAAPIEWILDDIRIQTGFEVELV
ncbi:unnamed protein product, partial [Clonostachys chloroleuca]